MDEPAGVLCIDLLEPMADAREDVEVLMEEVRTASGYLLAALLTMRVR